MCASLGWQHDAQVVVYEKDVWDATKQLMVLDIAGVCMWQLCCMVPHAAQPLSALAAKVLSPDGERSGVRVQHCVIM